MKTSNIAVDTPVENTSSITVEKAVKQGITFDPVTCCASMSRVNKIQEAVKYQYGKVEIGMPVSMDDIAAKEYTGKEYTIVEEWRLKTK